MQHEITHGPSFAMLCVDLEPGESVLAESGAMVARDSSVGMSVQLNGRRVSGFFGKLKSFVIAVLRKLVGGETMFVSRFAAGTSRGRVWLAPRMSGMLSHREMKGESLIVSTGAYVASTGDIDLRVRWGGFRGAMAREGLFFLEISGTGNVWFNSYGAIETIDVKGSYLVDTGHIVGYEGNLTFTIRSAGGGVVGFLASGEGLVCEFQGQGRVYIQSRNITSLASWLSASLPG